MMELDLEDEQLAVRDLARSLARGVVAPAAREAEATGTLPASVWAALVDSGLAVGVPEQHGGGGIPGCLTQLVAIEELAAGDPGIAVAMAWAGAAALLIGTCGTPAQQDAFFSAFAADPTRRGAAALYEGFGRAPTEYETRVSAGADGSWSVTGAKVAVPFAGSAPTLVVVGTDGRRLRAAVIEPGAAGVTVAPGPADGSLALGVAGLGSVRFDHRFPSDALLGGADGDDAPLSAAIGRLRLVPAAAAIGCARRAVEYAADYANQREAFGRAISSFQGVSFLLAEAAMRIQAARLELWDVAARIDEGQLHTEATVSRAVNYAGAVAAESARDALQVLGGHGFITDHPVERWYRSTATLSTIDFDPACTAFAPAL
jgi:alkylation response protein AidB-like acyl-CoA dehydrogenase